MDDLAGLIYHWGSAYKITYHRGVWTAARRDNGGTLTAGTAGELLKLIRDDYGRAPVPRDL
jgi:hypothetical protein